MKKNSFSVGDKVCFSEKAVNYYDSDFNRCPLDSDTKKTVWTVTKMSKDGMMLYLQGGSYGTIMARASTLMPFNGDSSVFESEMYDVGAATFSSPDGYQFTALGISGSGKTTFMAGMYYKMTAGLNGYTLKASDDDSVLLTGYYEQMNDANLGADRFPAGTNQSTAYSFELQYGYKTIEKFRWVDYAGGVLKAKTSGDVEEYQQLKKDISKSEVLYVFVDGGLFCDEEVQYAGNDSEKAEIITDIVQDNCSRYINHFLSEYTKERHKLPPIMIVITKYDLAIRALGKSDVNEAKRLLTKIIQRSFSPLFPDPTVYRGNDGYTNMVGIIPVSLGFKISEDDYKGKLRPINMHMPAYVGIWFMLKNSKGKGNESSLKKLSDEIEDSGIEFWLNGQSGRFSTLAEAYFREMKGVKV